MITFNHQFTNRCEKYKAGGFNSLPSRIRAVKSRVETDRVCSTHGTENNRRVFVGKPHKKRPLVRPIRRWNNVRRQTVYVKPNTEARSRNQCCREKLVSNTYSERARV
jgi:hypothetical protein